MSQAIRPNDVARWVRAYEWEGIAHANKRVKALRTVCPTLIGLFVDQRASDKANRDTAKILGAHRETRDTRAMIRRSIVAVDWAVRFAFPRYLDSGPAWVSALMADELRGLPPILWNDRQIEALQKVHKILIVAHSIKATGSTAERESAENVYVRAQQCVDAFAYLLPCTLSEIRSQADEANCDVTHAVAALTYPKPLSGDTDPVAREVRSALPFLVGRMALIQGNDSYESVASLCVWDKPKAKAVA